MPDVLKNIIDNEHHIENYVSDRYDELVGMFSRSSSEELGSGSERWAQGLKTPSQYRHLSYVFETFDQNGRLGQSKGAKSIELKIADDDSAETNLDAVVVVQVAVPVVKNYCPYDIILSHPLLDHDIHTNHGVRRGFLVVPATDNVNCQQMHKVIVYDGSSRLDSIKNDRRMCNLLEKLRYIIQDDEESDSTTMIDILRPETLENQIHMPTDIENGKLKDSYRFVNASHPYIHILRNEDTVAQKIKLPEAEGGHNFELDKKIKVGKKEIDDKRGAGHDECHLVPVAVIDYIERWVEKNLYQNLRLADVRRRNMAITVSRLDGNPLDHCFDSRKEGQDDGIRGLGAILDSDPMQRASGIFLSMEINCWPCPDPDVQHLS